MAGFEITTNAGPLGQALRNSPATIKRYLSPALTKSALIIARQAKRNVSANGSMANSTLVNSINSYTALDGLEAVAYAGANYARFVEFGTRGGGYPNQQTMIDWLRVKGIKPNNPDMSEKELAYVMARDIALNGTKAAPFMQPAFNSEKDATIDRVSKAINQAIKAVH